MATRSVRKQYKAIRDDIGDLHTWRPLPNGEISQIDPFLFLNHHGPQVFPPHNHGLPFGPHPHRGFETVTFIVEGSLTHRDTAGHENVIERGGVQWMTAGRGLEHAEVSPPEFMERGGPLEILQLWVNLPASLKFTEPHYTGLQKDAIPSFTRDGVTISLISGVWKNHLGPIDSLTDVQMMTVAMTAGSSVALPAPAGRNVFLYVVRGEIDVAGVRVPGFHLADLNDDGGEVDISAASDTLLLFGHAAPLGEPMVAHGPFVMNSLPEIFDAIRDYQDGKFG
jgi:redox-sensitive bicupin YhaK (pirin superfamily)